MLKNDLIELKNRLIEKYSNVENIAFFKDKNDSINIVIVSVIPNQVISLKSFNTELEETGYLNIFFHSNNRLFLDTIYCYDKYRGLNIASKLSELADFLLRDYENYIIRGVYEPSQLSYDRVNQVYCSNEELEERANNFYFKNGYLKLSYDYFINNQSLYSFINERDDFQLGEEVANCIIIKRITNNQSLEFKNVDGVIVENSILNSESFHSSVTCKK